MFSKFLSIFSSSAKVDYKSVKTYSKLVKAVNGFDFSGLNDTELKNKTATLKHQYLNEIAKYDAKNIEHRKKVLKGIMPEAFAVAREAANRALGMRHFDVQLIGGAVLFEGLVAEMKTGEGKTLVATLPAYLHSLSGLSTHIISVNDYLVQRDSSWMKPMFDLLGVSVGCITNELPPESRKEEYDKDVVYVENKELGFDYLRDNLSQEGDFMILGKGMHFAIVDEVDSILIDEARTPLVISGQVQQDLRLYAICTKVAKKLTPDMYFHDEEAKQILLNESGFDFIEGQLHALKVVPQEVKIYGSGEESMSPDKNTEAIQTILQIIDQSIKAHWVFKENTDYIVRKGEIHIVDEFTGRIMEGRRFSGGLHQALEAKHGVTVRPESQTIASITYQNLFRLYENLAGMTGTASSDANELHYVYGLNISVIPTNLKCVRNDQNDLIFSDQESKFKAIVEEVAKVHETGQPILVGTASIEQSEVLSSMFKKAKLQHNILNAKQHYREAQIIADAGKKGAITIATNMAGRGTDIVLGGQNSSKEEQQEVKDLGGLFVLGSERHQSRRVDNQLIGRAGRQGDPGRTRFYISLQDDLVRIFSGEKVGAIMSKLGFKDGETIDHPFLNKIIGKAQLRIESMNYDARKNIMKYDDIISEQRLSIYNKRYEVLSGECEMEDLYNDALEIVCESIVSLGLEKRFDEMKKFLRYMDDADIQYDSYDCIKRTLQTAYDRKCKSLSSPEKLQHAKNVCFVSSLDFFWRKYLHEIDILKNNVNLRAYGQKDPFMEFRMESSKAFGGVFYQVNETAFKSFLNVEEVKK